MKKFLSAIFILTILLGSLRPTLVHAATFTDFSYTASDYTVSASGVTYTFSFTTVTEVSSSVYALYAIWPSGFVSTSVLEEDVDITVDGVPQTLDLFYNTSGGNRGVMMSITNTIPAGSDVVITIPNMTNGSSAGAQSFYWVRTANGGGNAIDEASPHPTITLTAVSNRTLTYSAGTGGTLSGSMSQTVANGENGSAVTAIPNNGYYFSRWSDGSTQNPRTDLSVSGDITVSAIFSQNAARPVIAPVGAFQKDPTFKINDGAMETTLRDVILTFDAKEDSVAYYAVSQDPSMSGVSQQPYDGTVPFRLNEALGEQKVYAYLYSTTGQPSKLLEQTISLVEEKEAVATIEVEQVMTVSEPVNLVNETEQIAVSNIETKKPTYQFPRNLRLGDTGEEVGKLREFLDAEGFVTARVPLAELSKEERETFGPGLFQAVVKYQETHPEEILVPLSLKKGTGNFFEYTRAFVNKQLK